MKKPSSFSYFIVSLSFLTFCDVFLSNLISTKVQQGWHYFNSLFRIIYIENTGAAFSIMQNSTTLLIIASILALIGIVYFMIKNIENLFLKEQFFIALLSAGIIGNLYERIAFGHVRDFFDLTFINFPIFNISDIFINIGVLGIIILIIITKRNIKLS